MKIIIGGCGKIGETLLAALTAEGHDVVALDNNPAVVAQLTNIYDVMGVCGNAADCETLEDAAIAETELFIEAEAFALKKGNRSPRCAEQFIDSLLRKK